MSLVTIFVAVLCNSILGLFFVAAARDGQHGQALFRGWYWFDQKAALYGWVPLAIGLLAWTISYGKKPGQKSKAGYAQIADFRWRQA